MKIHITHGERGQCRHRHVTEGYTQIKKQTLSYMCVARVEGRGVITMGAMQRMRIKGSTSDDRGGIGIVQN